MGVDISEYRNTSDKSCWYADATTTLSGNIVFTPQDANNVGIFNPLNNTFHIQPFTLPGILDNMTNKFAGAALSVDGAVVFCPGKALRVGIFSPASRDFF